MRTHFRFRGMQYWPKHIVPWVYIERKEWQGPTFAKNAPYTITVFVCIVPTLPFVFTLSRY